MIRLTDEVVERLQEQARKYGDDEKKRFIDEVGWQDWMDDFAGGEKVTIEGIMVVDDILTQIFESVRQD